MARNRKRAKERRARSARPPRRPIATPGAGDATPDPIEHATPDVELAQAQLAIGRAEAEAEPEDSSESEPEPVAEAEFEDSSEPELEAEAEPEPAEVPEPDYGDEPYQAEGEEDEYEPEEEDESGNGGGPPVGTAVAPAGPSGVPAARPRSGNRLIGFLQGSWRELQRVQWPDRRQVVQATGVVIGFVIVAGLYLALADFAATKLMNYILK